MGTEPADRPLLDGYQQLVVLREAGNQFRIKRFGETRVGDGCGNALCREAVCGFETLLQTSAQGEQGDGVAFTDDSAAADFQRLAALRQGKADTRAAGIAEGGGSI